MKNFTNTKISELEKCYIDSNRNYHSFVLKQLKSIASSNNCILPNQFTIEIFFSDLDIIKEVLKDLGYPHIRNMIYKQKIVSITLC